MEQSNERRVTLVSIQIGTPKAMDGAGARDDRAAPWTSGLFKVPVHAPVFVTTTGIVGDGQADLTVHGGPDKAVCVYPSGHFEAWRERPELADMGPGGFGENFTLGGVDEAEVCIGDRWRVGEILAEVSQPRQPCWKLARKWGLRQFADEVARSGRTGWYLRVREEGWVEAGVSLTLIDRPHPEWTIAAANAVMHGRPRDLDGAARLSALPALSASWRATLGRRTSRD